MADVLLSLVGLVLLLALVAGVVVLPILALTRSARVPELLDRLDRLEREVHRLRAGAVPPSAVEAVPAPPDTVTAEPPPEPAPVVPTPARPEEILTALPAPAHRPPPPSAASIEAWLGARGLGWVAVVLLLFATAFFLQQAFEHDLIGELGRVILGLVTGAALCVAGFVCQRRGRPVFAQMLTAAGIILLYLSTFAAFGYYRLLPQTHGGYFLIALVIETAALAVLYEAPAVALMAVVGGLLTPLLLQTDQDRYVALFIYLGVLNAGVALLSRLRPAWPAVASVALGGTQLLFWGWYAVNYHPDKLAAALTFQAVLLVVHLAAGIRVRSGQRAGIEDLCRLAVAGLLCGAAMYALLEPQYHHWLGSLAIGLALVYTAVAWLVQATRPDDTRQLLVLVATAMAFVAASFPLEAGAAWAPLGWAVQGLALWCFALRIRSAELRFLGLAGLALAVLGVLVGTPGAHREPFLPVLNRYALPALGVVACLVGAAAAGRHFRAPLPELTAAVGLAGVGLFWVVLTAETRGYFAVRAERAYVEAAALAPRPGEGEERMRLREQYEARARRLERTGLAGVSVVWAVYAAALLAAGLRRSNRALRWVALGLFGLTLMKVGLVDTAQLAELYRAAVFLVLAVMMAAGAWGYQKVVRLTSAPDRAEEASREVV